MSREGIQQDIFDHERRIEELRAVLRPEGYVEVRIPVRIMGEGRNPFVCVQTAGGNAWLPLATVIPAARADEYTLVVADVDVPSTPRTPVVWGVEEVGDNPRPASLTVREMFCDECEQRKMIIWPIVGFCRACGCGDFKYADGNPVVREREDK